jgi:hypothetical protein
MNSTSRPYKIILALIELFFGIPFIGWLTALAHGMHPLILLILLHIIGIIFATKNHKSKVGHAIGVIADIIGFIPIISWIPHLIAGILLLIEGITDM